MRLAALLAIASISTSAAAQSPAVDRGWELYEQAEFAGALEAFDEAEARDSLTFDDWVRLLEGRALVFFAGEDLEAMGATLAQLARVAPDHTLAPDAPPEIVRAFLDARSEVSEPLRLELEGEREGGGFRLRALLVGDRGDLVLSLRTYGRPEGGEWTQSDDTLRIEADSVEAHAEALGPGGARVRTRGSSEDPLRFALETGPTTSGPNLRLIFGIGGGALGAVLIATLVAVLATRDADTQPNPPRVVE